MFGALPALETRPSKHRRSGSSQPAARVRTRRRAQEEEERGAGRGGEGTGRRPSRELHIDAHLRQSRRRTHTPEKCRTRVRAITSVLLKALCFPCLPCLVRRRSEKKS